MIRINYRGYFYNGHHIIFNAPMEGHFCLKVETFEEGEHGPEKVWKTVFEGLAEGLIAVFSISQEEWDMEDMTEGQGD